MILGAHVSIAGGVQNAPLNGGSRLLEWNHGSTVITNRSGVSRNVTNDWICVARRYGVACGPSGFFKYQAATGYSHGTAEDTLQFIPTNSLLPRYAVWFPGQNAAQTASNASRVNWVVSATNFALTFPGPTGSLRRIIVSQRPLSITGRSRSAAASPPTQQSVAKSGRTASLTTSQTEGR